jgi:hypothetical protein
MIRVWRCGSLMGVLMLGLACGTEPPTAPSAISAPPNTAPPTSTQPPQRLPPTGDPVATYVFSGPIDYNVRGFTTGSQYLLYDNGVFGLRYEALALVYLGTYEAENDTITFRFDGAWTLDRGIAIGTLKGDLLEIRYSDIMEHSDFENAVYRRSR